MNDFDKAVLNFFNPGMGDILDLDIPEWVEPEPVWKDEDIDKVQELAKVHMQWKTNKILYEAFGPNVDWTEKEWQSMKKIIKQARAS